MHHRGFSYAEPIRRTRSETHDVAVLEPEHAEVEAVGIQARELPDDPRGVVESGLDRQHEEDVPHRGAHDPRPGPKEWGELVRQEEEG